MDTGIRCYWTDGLPRNNKSRFTGVISGRFPFDRINGAILLYFYARTPTALFQKITPNAAPLLLRKYTGVCSCARVYVCEYSSCQRGAKSELKSAVISPILRLPLFLACLNHFPALMVVISLSLEDNLHLETIMNYLI